MAGEIEGPDVAVTVTADTAQASDQLKVMQSGFTRLESSGISSARRIVSGVQGMMGAINSVYDAQQRLNVANINYTLTVREYGAGSIQATRALDQLQVAQNGLALANERVNLQYLQFALSVGPQVYSTITKLMAAIAGTTLANYVETESWYAKAVAMAVAGGIIGVLVLGMSMMAAQAQVNTNVNQTNNYYGTAAVTPQTMAGYANTSIVNQLSGAVSP